MGKPGSQTKKLPTNRAVWTDREQVEVICPLISVHPEAKEGCSGACQWLPAVIRNSIDSVSYHDTYEKELSNAVSYGNFFFAVTFEAVVNAYLDVKLNWYGYFNTCADWGYLPLAFLLFGCFNVIYCNFLPRKWGNRTLYIAGAIVFVSVYEYLLHRFTGDLYYNEWRYHYSVLS